GTTNAVAAPPAGRQALSNAVLDERWRQSLAALEAADPRAVIRTGWESEPVKPVWIDPAVRRPLHPVDGESGEPWVLCRDEAALAAAGLPPYGSTLHRYLYLPKQGPKSAFIPVTPEAP